MSQPGSQYPFSTHSVIRNGVARIALEGELDLATVPLFKRRLAHVDAEADGHGPPHLLLDLRGLTFMDSSGLQAVLAAFRSSSERGREFATVGVAPPVLKLFEVTGTEGFLGGASALGLIERFMKPGEEAKAR